MRLLIRLIGYLGDRTNTRWGRRRVWMVASIPILIPAVYFLFFPNEETVTAMYLFILASYVLARLDYAS